MLLISMTMLLIALGAGVEFSSSPLWLVWVVFFQMAALIDIGLIRKLWRK
jgi:hypothetical protein